MCRRTAAPPALHAARPRDPRGLPHCSAYAPIDRRPRPGIPLIERSIGVKDAGSASFFVSAELVPVRRHIIGAESWWTAPLSSRHFRRARCKRPRKQYGPRTVSIPPKWRSSRRMADAWWEIPDKVSAACIISLNPLARASLQSPARSPVITFGRTAPTRRRAPSRAAPCSTSSAASDPLVQAYGPPCRAWSVGASLARTQHSRALAHAERSEEIALPPHHSRSPFARHGDKFDPLA